MKKVLAILPLFALLFLSGCGDSRNIVEYNDSFVALVKDCTDANQALFENYNEEGITVESIADSLQNCIDICQSSRDKAISLGDFEKDSTLKDAVVNLLDMEVEYLNKFADTQRYRNIDNLTDDDKMEYNSIVNDLTQSEESLNNQFNSLQSVQELFASKHNLILEN